MVGWFSGSCSGVCWYVTMKELACAEHEARSLANKKNSRKQCSCRCDDTDSEVKAAEMLNHLRSQENGTHNTMRTTSDDTSSAGGAATLVPYGDTMVSCRAAETHKVQVQCGPAWSVDSSPSTRVHGHSWHRKHV